MLGEVLCLCWPQSTGFRFLRGFLGLGDQGKGGRQTQRERERERKSVCVCVTVFAGLNQRVFDFFVAFWVSGIRVKEGDRHRERERERERERVCVCVTVFAGLNQRVFDFFVAFWVSGIRVKEGDRHRERERERKSVCVCDFFDAPGMFFRGVPSSGDLRVVERAGFRRFRRSANRRTMNAVA